MSSGGFEPGRGPDAIGIYLTGAVSPGADQPDPALSLGGYRSGNRVRPLGFLLGGQDPFALAILGASGEAGEGEGTLATSYPENLTYAAPGEDSGATVVLDPGEERILPSEDPAKWLRVRRDITGDLQNASCELSLRLPLGGVIGQSEVSNAQRVAGVETYRAVMIMGQGTLHAALRIRAWIGSLDCQASYALAWEALGVGGDIQVIVDEETEPLGLSFSSPTTEETAIEWPFLNPGDVVGLWIRRTFPPAGDASAREVAEIRFSFDGA